MTYEVSTTEKRLHLCNACGRQFHWSESSRWFGSDLQLDNQDPLFKFCTTDCAEDYRRRFRLRAQDGTTPDKPREEIEEYL